MIRLVRGLVAVAAVAALLAACSPSGSSGGQGTDSGTPVGFGTPSASVPTSAPRPPSSGAGPRAASAGWLTYHGDPGRSGYAEAPAAVHSLAVGRRTRLDGPVYAQPLVAPHRGGDVTIVATEANSVYALRDGTVVWRAQLGAPVPLAALPCGNVDPLGITGTPVVDPASSTVYVVAELDGPVRHELVAIDTATGAVRWRRGIDPPGAQPRFEQERAALALSGGRVWVALGGLYGDCGPYHGKVVGVATNGTGDLDVYQVPSGREAGIWAPSGPAVNAVGHLFVAVGNGEATSGAWDGSDSILELDGGRVVSSFAPAGWQEENAQDADLGSMGPLLLPRGLLVAAGKAGDVYVLRQGQLGGIGHPLARWSGCAAYGGPAADVRGQASGSVTVVLPCVNGISALRVNLATGQIRQLWQAPPSVAGSPVIAGDIVLAVDRSGGRLVALDLNSGQQRAAVGVGSVSRFATPLLAGNTAVVGTMDGVVTVTPG